MKGLSKVLWLVLPIIVILSFIIIDYGGSEHKNTYEQKGFFIKPSKTIFTPIHIVNIVNRNNDFIDRTCIDNGFKLDDSPIDPVYKNTRNRPTKYGYYQKKYLEQERVTLWEERPNRLEYLINDKERYDDFIEQLYKLNPSTLTEEEYDTLYKNSPHLLIDNCVFVPLGNKPNTIGYIIAAIRQDNICTASQAEQEVVPEEDLYIVTADTAYMYRHAISATQYSDTIIRKGEIVKFLNRNSEFYYCEYTNKNGKVMEGYVYEKYLTRVE